MKPVRERRLFARRPLKTDVYFEDESGDRLFYVQSRDISLGGLFLKEDLPLVSGTLLFVSFSLPKLKKPIRITAEVVRKGEEGIGVRFVGLPAESRKLLERYLEK